MQSLLYGKVNSDNISHSSPQLPAVSALVSLVQGIAKDAHNHIFDYQVIVAYSEHSPPTQTGRDCLIDT